VVLGISLNSYPYLKLQKHYAFLLLFMFTKLEKGQKSFCLEAKWLGENREIGVQGREMAQIMYTHMNK
jgi:hypothetical protein